MKFSRIYKLKEYKRISIGIVFVLFLFLCSGIFQPILNNFIKNNWNYFSQKKAEEKANLIQNQFNDLENGLKNISDEISSELNHQMISSGTNIDFSIEKYFELFTKYSEKYDLDLILTNQEGKILVWTNELRNLAIEKFLSKNENFYITSNNFNSYLNYSRVIFKSSDKKYYLILSQNILTDYKLTNQYLHKVFFYDENLNIDTKIEFVFEIDSSVNSKNDYLIKDLNHVNGEKAGKVKVSYENQDEIISEFNESIIRFQKYLILILVFIFYYFLFKDFRKINSYFVKGFLLTLFIWLLRYFLIFLQIPSTILEISISNPFYFSSSLGGGLFKSPLELFITAVFGLINSYYIFLLSRRWYIESHEKETNVYKRILFSFIIIFLSAIVPLLLRAYAESIRSFIFDSGLQYFDAVSIIPSFPFVFMHISVFLSCTGFVVLIISVLTINLKILKSFFNFNNNILAVLVLISSYILFSIGFKIIFDDSLFSYIFVVLFGLLLILIFHNYRKYDTVFNFNLLVIILIISSITSIFLLIEKGFQKEKELQRRVAFELAKPKDILYGFLLNESLINGSQQNELIKLLSEKRNDTKNLVAYNLWVSSILNAEDIRSGLTILNPDKQVVSAFGFGVDLTFNYLDFLNDNLFNDDFIYFNNITKPEYLYGAAKVFDGDKVVGYLIINILVKKLNNELGSSSKIFASIQKEKNPLQLLPDAVIYKFTNGEFKLEQGDNLPEFRPLPDQIADKILITPTTEIWIDEKIEEKNFTTFYFLYQQNNLPRLLAVSVEKKSFLWYSFNFFRFAFIHFLLSAILILSIIFFLFSKGYKFKFYFKSKLFGGLLLITFIPLLLLAFYNRDNAIERWIKTQRYELRKDLDFVSSRFKEFEESDVEIKIDDISKYFDKISETFNYDFDIYHNQKLIYTTQKNLYDIEFFIGGYPGSVYMDFGLLNKTYSYRINRIGLYEYLTGYKKIKIQNINDLVIAIPSIYKKDVIDNEIAQIDAFIFGAYSFTLIFIFILGNIIFERISKPLKKLTEATKKIAAGDLSVKLENEDKTEVGDLVIAFNKMISDLEESRKILAQAEREYAWKEMAKQVAHEIKNPLTPMKLSLQHLQLLYKVNRDEFYRIFNKVSNSLVEQIEILSKISNEFSLFARMPNRKLVDLDLVELINNSIDIYESNFKIAFDYDKELKYIVNADYEELKRVCINLIKNSIQAKSNTIQIKLTKTEKSIQINFIDDGEGMSEENKAKVFQPNFSTKTDGMGLGLSIIKKIIEDLNGEIYLTSELNKGTIVTIKLISV